MGRAVAVMGAAAAAIPGLVLTDADSPWAGCNPFTIAAPVAEDNDDEAEEQEEEEEEEEEVLVDPAVMLLLRYWF